MSVTEIISLINDKLQAWAEAAVSMVPNLILAVLIVVLAMLLGKILSRLVEGVLHKYSDNEAATRILRSLTYVAILAFGMFVAMGVLQLERTVTSLLAGVGVIGLALGFAFQEIASNFVAGILIAFRKPYQLDDIIEIESWQGQVTGINLRTTSITTFQGLEVIIPNKTMFTTPFINYTTTPQRRIDLKVGVSYGDDLEKVERVSREALQDVTGRIESEEIGIYFQEFEDSSINFVAQVWIEYPGQKNYLRALHDAVMNLKAAYAENDITIPFPIRTLDFGIKGGTPLRQMMHSES